jgi:antitoxin (DNA-binding transcriptional repressor) of toxin-antitoxin stability system
MADTTITATQLARQLSDVLNRVKYRGERFIIQRNGETVATIAPPCSVSGTTWTEFTARVPNLELPGDGFADDLEKIQASQGIAEMPEWPD